MISTPCVGSELEPNALILETGHPEPSSEVNPVSFVLIVNRPQYGFLPTGLADYPAGLPAPFTVSRDFALSMNRRVLSQIEQKKRGSQSFPWYVLLHGAHARYKVAQVIMPHPWTPKTEYDIPPHWLQSRSVEQAQHAVNGFNEVQMRLLNGPERWAIHVRSLACTDVSPVIRPANEGDSQGFELYAKNCPHGQDIAFQIRNAGTPLQARQKLAEILAYLAEARPVIALDSIA